MDGAALAAAIADIWGTTNPAAAADWIQSLPSGPGKDEAAATLATVWAASDIEAATAWSGSLADASVRRQAITHIGTLWGAMEPDKALAWLGSQPQELATEGYAGAYNSWAATDAVGLGEWIAEAQAAGQLNPALPAEVVLYTLFARACDPVLGLLKAGGNYGDEELIEILLSSCFDGLAA